MFTNIKHDKNMINIDSPAVPVHMFFIVTV